LIKLRWVSIFYTNSNTADYQARLLKQLGNNARIAFYNKHSTWFSGMMVTLFLIVQSYTADLSQSALIKQFTLLALICVFFLLPYYLWARKRQQRFEKELASLHTLTNNVQDKPA
jgi:Flp pilus assembly protein TadB